MAFNKNFSIKTKKELDQILKRKQNERIEDFTRLRSMYQFGIEETKIVNLSFNDLIQKLHTREITATRVLEAFVSKTLDVSRKCNPVTEFIPQAFKWAKELDGLTEIDHLPLFGVPFAVKDDTDVEGMDTTHGFAKRLYQPASESAVIVKILKDLGAIPFCKTNVPQGLCNIGGDNPVFGATVNPFNENLSPGGSSSGTGALVGARGIHFGTGTDMGGSLRIPAHFCGCTSLKPTSNRLSTRGFQSPIQPCVVGTDSVAGIIGQTTDTVATVMKLMVESGKNSIMDPTIPPVPWNTVEYFSLRKLRIGYCTSMPYFPPIGSSAEVVNEAKVALESIGHTLIPFELPDAFHFMKIFAQMILADDRDFKRIWVNEKISNDAKRMVDSLKLPKWSVKLLARLLGTKLIPSIHSTRSSAFLGSGITKSSELWDVIGEKKLLIRQLLSELDSKKLDAVILNVLPFPALHRQSIKNVGAGMCYTVLWNLVDFPAGVVPFRVETAKNIADFDDQGDMHLREAKKVIRESIGLPIGVQVVGRCFHEEIVLRIMKELEPFCQFHPDAEVYFSDDITVKN